MSELRTILKEKVPAESLDYCIQLWQQYPFRFVLNRKRVSKLGDYRFDPRTNAHTVTVNEDLNEYQFLLTYIHEVAHRVVNRKRGLQKPHGIEWKLKFKELMLPMLQPAIFPEDLLGALARHMKNPKASVSGDVKLATAFSKYDEYGGGLTLAQVCPGEEFVFRKRRFEKIEKKRTRSVCLDLENGKKYLIPELADVER